MLTEREKLELNGVKTNKEQAHQIRSRNISLLEILNYFEDMIYEDDYKDLDLWSHDGFNDVYRRIEKGCPHCQEARYKNGKPMNCKECAWTQGYRNDIYACTEQSFNGVSYRSMESYSFVSIIYGCSNAKISIGRYSFIRSGLDDEEKEMLMEEVENCRKFLNGHIEWADIILNG